MEYVISQSVEIVTGLAIHSKESGKIPYRIVALEIESVEFFPQGRSSLNDKLLSERIYEASPEW